MTLKFPLLIDGERRAGSSGASDEVLNPATGTSIGRVAHASTTDLDDALAAASRGLREWSSVPGWERGRILKEAARRLEANLDAAARTITTEQGKPLAEAKAEVTRSAEFLEWAGEQARRIAGRTFLGREVGNRIDIETHPIGVVAAFTPWNFPINQAVRKVSAALCTGCSVILKGPEDTPASCTALIQALLDAGVPGDVLGLVYGDPAEISSYLIPHPVIRKITFTGSTAIGKELAALAGKHMKRATKELGGHAPAIVFRDADVQKAVQVLGANKYRNAGQVCVAPTRFLVHESVFDAFVDGFVGFSRDLTVGNGLEAGVKMGPLAHGRRIEAMEAFVADAEQKGAQLRTGGKRIGNQGNFFEPTVFTDVPLDARIMNEEPFGPIAAIRRFSDDEEAFTEANRLPYGLAAYAYTRSAETATKLATRVESGMMSINHHGIALPETPFGGVKDSGYGSEGGSEAIEAYLNTKFVTQAGF